MRYRRLFETAKDGILLLAAETAQSGTAAGVFICDVMGHDVCAALNRYRRLFETATDGILLLDASW